MQDREAIEMMRRCQDEIQSLRFEINRLRPKAEAYDSIAQILALLPRPSQGMSQDIIWTLDKRIREIEAALAANPVVSGAKDGRPRSDSTGVHAVNKAATPHSQSSALSNACEQDEGA